MSARSLTQPVHLLAGALLAALVAAAGVTAGLSAPGIGTSPAGAPQAVVVPPAASGRGASGAGSSGQEASGQGSSGQDASGQGPTGEGPAGQGSAGGATTSTGTGAVGAAPTSPLPHAATDWVTSRSAATGIPARALQAYADATLAVQESDPRCGLGWTTLAAIGAVESGHGTHGGTTLGADGRPLVRILGPALDGRSGFAAIAATADSATWTGDPSWDHAVGPMQFLSSTWARWGVDGDGDGIADPNDLDDAALAAAHYLCAAGGDLRTATGWTDGVLAYNHDDRYAASVLARANAYAAAR